MQKQQHIQACLNRLHEKVRELKTIVAELSESVNSETKSTAGDKHETGRAMIQLEQEKTGKQLKEAEQQLAEFEKINFNKVFQSIELGSLVLTDKGFFFIASSIGKIIVDDKPVFVISDKSPLAEAFLGKQKNSLNFNGVDYLIENIT